MGISSGHMDVELNIRCHCSAKTIHTESNDRWTLGGSICRQSPQDLHDGT